MHLINLLTFHAREDEIEKGALEYLYTSIQPFDIFEAEIISSIDKDKKSRRRNISPSLGSQVQVSIK